MHARDVEMLTAMGANAVRVYGVQKNYNYHGELWDMLHAANITVMAGFDIYGQFLADRGVMERVKYELRETLRANHHPAIGMAIGNELNGAWNGWVGDPGDCAAPASSTATWRFYSSIDELCQWWSSGASCAPPCSPTSPSPAGHAAHLDRRPVRSPPPGDGGPDGGGGGAGGAHRARRRDRRRLRRGDALRAARLPVGGLPLKRSRPRFGNDYYGDATDDGTFRFAAAACRWRTTA